MQTVEENRRHLLKVLGRVAKEVRSHNIEPLAFNTIFSSIKSDKTGDFLALSSDDPELVSYAATPENKLNSDKRIKTTINRYIRRRIGLDNAALPDKILDKYGKLVAANIEKSIKIDDQVKIFSGKKLSDFYAETEIESCMTGEDNSAYIELYAKNPNKVKLVNFRNSRALLWFCDDGKVVLDRIYPSGTIDSERLISWAKRKKYLIRDQSCSYEGCSTLVPLSDRSVRKVTLKDPIYDDEYPFLDTFKFGIKQKNRRLQLQNKHIPNKTSTIDEGFELASCYVCKKQFNSGSSSELSFLGYNHYKADDCYICRKCLSKLDAGNRFYCKKCSDLKNTEKSKCGHRRNEVYKGMSF